MRQRTIKNMTPKAQHTARRLWELMYDLEEGSDEFCRVRDQYHAMFRNNSNFVSGTEPYCWHE